MTWKKWFEDNCREDLDSLLQLAFDNIDESLTCYDNFKDIIVDVYAAWFEKWFLIWQNK